MAAANYIDTVQQFYIAYYGRPADPEGLAYWTEQLDAAKGVLDEILDDFGTSAEADTLFGGDRTTEASVEALYQQILGRAADPEGLEFYSTGIDDGEFTLVDVAKRIVDGIQGEEDTQTLANKVVAAKAFTDAIDESTSASYVGDDAANVARNWLNGVLSDEESLEAAQASLQEEITNITPITRALVAGAETITGSAVNDTFTAVSSSLSSEKTLDISDKIDGKTGADSLSVTVKANFTGFTTGSVSGVETLDLTNSGTTARTFDMSGFSGVETINLDATKAALALVDIPQGVATISLTGQVDGALSVRYATDADEVTGTADAITLELSDVGEDDAVSIDVQSIETFNIESSGTNLITFANNTTKTITVSGSGDIEIENTGSGLTSFDASEATGNVTVDLTDAQAGALKSEIKTGSGDDVVTYDEVDGPSNAKFNLGDGDDVLVLNSDGGTVEYTLVGAETLDINTTSGNLIYSARKTTGLELISTNATTNGDVSIVNTGSTNLTIEAVGVTLNKAVKVDTTGDITLNYTKTTTSATTTDAPLADYTFANAAGSLVINVGANTNPAGSDVTANKVKSLEVNVATAVSSTTEYTILGNTTITAAVAESLVINSDGQLSSVVFDMAKATSADITNGESIGTVILKTPALTDLTVETGASLTLTGGATNLSKLETLTVVANDGTVTFGALTAINQIDLSGAGEDSKVVFNGLGATANEYDLTVTASGLEANLETGAITIGAGFDVTINADGLDGALTIGNVASSGSEGDNVSIFANDIDEAVTVGAVYADKNIVLEANNAGAGVTVGTLAAVDVTIAADDATGAVSIASGSTVTATGDVVIEADNGGSTVVVGNITATGDVSVNASGVTGRVTIGTLNGDNVSANISGSGALSAVNSSITAKTSANLVLNDLENNTSNNTAKTGSTGLTITVVGGIGDDTITVTGNATSKSFVISGDLSASSNNDTLTISTIANNLAQTINLSALEGYETAEINTAAGNDTIIGGEGADKITAGVGADSLTGGAGADIFFFNKADSKVASYDTITDLYSEDVIHYGSADPIVIATDVALANAANKAVITNGVASFTHLATTAYDTLQKMVDLIDLSVGTEGHAVYFEYLGSTFLFIDTNDPASEVVVKLAGVALPTDATSATTGTTGLTGIGG